MSTLDRSTNPSSVQAFLTRLLNRLQYLEDDAHDAPELALYFLKELNQFLVKASRVQKASTHLPDALRVDTAVIAGLIWDHVSDIYFRGWGAVRNVTGIEPPSIGRGWNKLDPTELSPAPNLLVFRASIQQFLKRYRVQIELHARKLAVVSPDRETVPERIEVGFPASEMDQIQTAKKTEPSTPAYSETDFNAPTLIPRTQVVKMLEDKFRISHTMAYREIKVAENNKQLKAIAHRIGRCEYAYREREVEWWISRVRIGSRSPEL